MGIRSCLKNIGVCVMWSKMGVATQDSKIGCMSRRKESNKLIFGVLIQIQES